MVSAKGNDHAALIEAQYDGLVVASLRVAIPALSNTLQEQLRELLILSLRLDALRRGQQRCDPTGESRYLGVTENLPVLHYLPSHCRVEHREALVM